MNRTLFQAASAALLCFALVACGGGGGSDSPSIPTTTSGVGAGGTGTSIGTGSTDTGGKTTIGTNDPTPAAPGDGNVYPIPNCTPRQVVVSLLGDSNMHQMFLLGELQKDLDAHFGPGAAVVYNYALAGDMSDTYLYITGDVILENYGAADMMAGKPTAALATNIAGMHTTLVVTQTPVISQLYDPTPYLAVENGAGFPVADAYNYVLGLVGVMTITNPDGSTHLASLGDLIPDGLHPINDALNGLTDNVIAPQVFKQVAPLRCELN